MDKKEYMKEYRMNNKEKLLENRRRWYRDNREKSHENVRKWVRMGKQDKKKLKNNQLKNKYGITLKQYDEMLESQNNKCLICGKTPEENGRRLSVDHCHKTEKVRGLLCHLCNVGIGSFQDDVDLLLKAIKYLSKIETNK